MAASVSRPNARGSRIDLPWEVCASPGGIFFCAYFGMNDGSIFPRISRDAESVARAMALRWSLVTRSQILDFLRHSAIKTESGKTFTQEAVGEAQEALRRASLVVEDPRRQGYWRLADGARAQVYDRMLEDTPRERLEQMLAHAFSVGGYTAEANRARYWDANAALAHVCLAVYSGASPAQMDQLRQSLGYQLNYEALLNEACLREFHPGLFARMHPDLRYSIAFSAAVEVCERWSLQHLPWLRWIEARCHADPAAVPGYLRAVVAQAAIYQGNFARAEALIESDASALMGALRAGLAAARGQWPEAQAGFEASIKRLQLELGRRKNILPDGIAWFHVIALLAQRAPTHLRLAQRYCKSRVGPQHATTGNGWRRWAHALAVRLGEETLDLGHLELVGHNGYWMQDFWSCLARAWLGKGALPEAGAAFTLRRKKMVDALGQRLRSLGFVWLDAQLSAAEAVFEGGEPPDNFFIHGARESWRAVLSSLQALGQDAPSEGGESATRIVWCVTLARDGAVESIDPMEQKRGARGWGRSKPLPLSRLVNNTKLSPWDAKVARAIKRDRFASRGHVLDRAQAIVSLIGHPAVALDSAPELTLDLIEGTPELEVTRQGDHYVLRITPDIRAQPDAGREGRQYYPREDERETEALRYITVLVDSPRRARVIQLSPAQRRAAQLVSGRFAVPTAGEDDLRRTLEVLAAHFRVDSDHVQAAREIAPESRLRAELSPVGNGLLLNLVVAPLGVNGPRLVPGQGRRRVMAAVQGETVGAARDLAAEQAHVDALLSTLDFLEAPRGAASCEWRVDDPEQALTLVEILPTHASVQAVDWPKGKPVRVISLSGARLGIKVSSGRDWFTLQARARVDETLVLELETLLDAAVGGSRFIPMGEGVYAALTRDLRARLAALHAVGEKKDGKLRVSRHAVAWLDEVLDELDVQADAAFSGRLERLREAQSEHAALPATLQTPLREYQEQGYRWAMRLARAGFGACLADDMGLGKTVQTLAVLLARASGGPALVIAPTSVCGNWKAEALRFAPSLNAKIYGEGDRAAAIESATAGDLVIVSYALMAQSAEAFAAKHWHTLVADEAQAVKNATARRSQALFDIEADFRMALSGTPIENRLSELWSIMRYCNPGLLGTTSHFNEAFAVPIERERDREAQRILRRLIAPFVLRRTKAQVLEDLPPRTELLLTVEPEPAQAAHYEALRRSALADAQDALADAQAGQAQFHVLALLTKLRRAACDPRLVNPELGIPGAKVAAFAELAAELTANGHKALVFSQFVDFLALLREPLDNAGIRYQYLDGATPAAERSKRVAAFQAGDGHFFLISLKAGGFGLNLTAADYVVITDPWWNPAAEDQAMGRAHRIGQARPVTVYRLIGKGTLEQSIVELHHAKRALADGLLAEGDDPSAVPSVAELIELMRGGSRTGE